MITDMLGAFGALIFVLGLLILIMWGIKRIGVMPGQPTIRTGKKSIDILESRVLDSRNRLVAVRWKGQEYLLGVNQNGTRLIDSEMQDEKVSTDLQQSQ